jgi:hypothetical protein
MDIEWNHPHRVIMRVNGKTLLVGGEGLFDRNPDFLIYPSSITHWEDGSAITEDERRRLLEDLVAEAARRGWKFEIGVLWARSPVIYIEAPAKVTADADALFLAGGISGCPDWQSEAASMLRHTPYTVLNPRRKAFPTEDRAAIAEQIAWEYAGLRMAAVIVFWFHHSEVQPIALYELGSAVASGKLISVGAHPAYSRRIDLELQLEVAQVRGMIHDSLEHTILNAIRLLEETN